MRRDPDGDRASTAEVWTARILAGLMTAVSMAWFATGLAGLVMRALGRG